MSYFRYSDVNVNTFHIAACTERGGFLCVTSGKCIHKEWKCDGSFDCGINDLNDYSDENMCGGN